MWTSPPGTSLVGELLDAVTEIRSLVGPDPRPTIVFDRGGWSPKTFRQLVDDHNFDILTYRKGEVVREPASAFRNYTHIDEHGVAHTYRLADRTVRIAYKQGSRERYFECRQITRDCGNGHHTTILTTRTDPNPALLAHAMFGRWKEENFFRYMRSRFDLDGLDSYATIADDPDRSVPNPAKKAAARTTKQLKRAIASGQASLDRHRRENLAALRASVDELEQVLGEVRTQLVDHQKTAKAIPARVPLGQLRDASQLHHGEHKRIVDAIRMACYNAESSLARAIRPHLARGADQARTLLREALAAPADLHIVEGRLHVTLNPLSAPRRTRAIARLCQELTDTETIYPGTDLQLVYTIKTPGDLK